MNPDMKPGTLRCVSWDEVGTRVTIPAWKKFTSEYSAALEGVTAESLPDQIPKLRHIGSGIRDPKGMLLDPQQRTQRAGFLFGAGLALALIDHGWTLHSGPGVFHLQHGAEQLNPFSVVEQLMSGKLTRQDWIAQCNALGIGRACSSGRAAGGATRSATGSAAINRSSRLLASWASFAGKSTPRCSQGLKALPEN